MWARGARLGAPLFILCFNRTAFAARKSGLKSSVFHSKLFSQISSKSYRHNAVPNRFSSRFSTSRTNGPRSLSQVKSGTHSSFGERSHTRAHTAKQGRFGRGWYHYPRSVPHVHEHPRAGYQNGKLCRFWILAGCTPEERREPSEQRCAYACRCSAGVAAPLGCAALTVEFLAFLLLLKTTIANSLTPWYYGVTKSESIG